MEKQTKKAVALSQVKIGERVLVEGLSESCDKVFIEMELLKGGVLVGADGVKVKVNNSLTCYK